MDDQTNSVTVLLSVTVTLQWEIFANTYYDLPRIILSHPPGHGVDAVLLLQHRRHKMLAAVLLHVVVPEGFHSELILIAHHACAIVNNRPH